MSAHGFTVRHARNASFERGLHLSFEYRDPGVISTTVVQRTEPVG